MIKQKRKKRKKHFVHNSMEFLDFNGLLMIVGASTCEVGVVYVGIMSHLPTG